METETDTNTPNSSHIEAEQRWANAGENLAVLNFSEKIIEEKERHLRECIQSNYSRIKDVERELSGLQMQLKLSTGPKKSALMMIRKKIELQNERVLAARERQKAAKKVFEATDEALKEEDAVKERLCNELNMLVQQSAHAQLEKLEQLTDRLEKMNQCVGRGKEFGLPAEQVAAAEAVIEALKKVPGAAPSVPAAASNSEAPQQQQQASAPAASQSSEQESSAHTGPASPKTPREAHSAAVPSASKAPQQPDPQFRPLQRQDSPGRVTSQGAPLRKPSLSGSASYSTPAERQRQNTGAAAARSRHVNISPRSSGTAAPPALPPSGQASGTGQFRGFDT